MPGGFYQPTTRSERDELYATLAEKHRELYGNQHRNADETLRSLSETQLVDAMTKLTSELPRETVHATVTPSGYAWLGRNGRPYKPGDGIQVGTRNF